MRPSACVLVAILFCFSAFFVFLGLHSVYGIGIFSKDEKPFGKSYDEWAAEYWSKYLAKNTAQTTPPGGFNFIPRTFSIRMVDSFEASERIY